MTPEQRKYIDELIWRKNIEVIKTMKQIPEGELFSWKFEEKENETNNKKIR